MVSTKCCSLKADIVFSKLVDKLAAFQRMKHAPTDVMPFYNLKTETLMLEIKGRNGDPPDARTLKAAMDTALEACCGTKN